MGIQDPSQWEYKRFLNRNSKTSPTGSRNATQRQVCAELKESGKRGKGQKDEFHIIHFGKQKIPLTSTAKGIPIL